MKRALNLTNSGSSNCGVYGSYFKLDNKKGVKVIGENGHTTLAKLKKSRVWRRATKESTLIRTAQKRYSLIPRSYGTIAVKFFNRYYPGILMQHIEGKELWEIMKDEEVSLLSKSIFKKLKEHGIIHEDLHGGNLIKCKATKKIYVIDFSPDFVEILNEDTLQEDKHRSYPILGHLCL